jgi:hypothetical protein
MTAALPFGFRATFGSPCADGALVQEGTMSSHGTPSGETKPLPDKQGAHLGLEDLVRLIARQAAADHRKSAFVESPNRYAAVPRRR